MGAETFLYLTTGDHRFISRVDARELLRSDGLLPGRDRAASARTSAPKAQG